MVASSAVHPSASPWRAEETGRKKRPGGNLLEAVGRAGSDGRAAGHGGGQVVAVGRRQAGGGRAVEHGAVQVAAVGRWWSGGAGTEENALQAGVAESPAERRRPPAYHVRGMPGPGRCSANNTYMFAGLPLAQMSNAHPANT